MLVPQFPLVDGVAQLPDTPSVAALRWVQDQVGRDATPVGAVEARFSPSFLAAITADAVVDVIAQLRAGVAQGFEPIDVRVVSEYLLWIAMGSPNPSAARTSSTYLIRVGVDPNTGLINEFLAQPTGRGLASWVDPSDTDASITEAVSRLATKAPQVSVVVARLDDHGCTVIAGHNETERRGIASLFKTWVLGALAAEIDAGRIGRHDIVTFTPGRFMRLGSSATSQFTTAIDLTVQQAANLMMQISDNGATDVLHELVGRTKVDGFVSSSGHAAPWAVTPVLTVSEFGHLYGNSSAEQIERWLISDQSARRALAESTLTPLGPKLEPSIGTPPVDRLSWQASPIDMCRTLAVLRERFSPRSEAGALIDEAFGGQAFLFGLRNEWDRVWYKGGSHPGYAEETILVRTDGFLVESNDGGAYAVIAMFNSDADIAGDPFIFEVQSLYARIMVHLIESGSADPE